MQDILKSILQSDILDSSNQFDSDKVVSDRITKLILDNSYKADQILFVLKKILSMPLAEIQQKKMMPFRSSFILAKILDDNGYKDPCISLLICVHGLLYKNSKDAERGLKMLQEQTDAQSVAQQQFMDTSIISQVIIMMTKLTFHDPRIHHEFLLHIICVLKAAVPQFRTIFNADAHSPDLSLSEMRQRGREQANIVINPLPPAHVARVRRRVLIMVGENYPFAIGLRFNVAMESYGWNAEVCDFHQYALSGQAPTEMLHDSNASENCRSIVETCRQKNIDLILFDANMLGRFKRGFDAYKTMKQQLLQDNPSIKILGLVLDVQADAEQSALEMMVELLDGILTHLPAKLLIQTNPYYEPLTQKMLFTSQTPVGDNNFGDQHSPMTRPVFTGSVSTQHWVRGYWIFHATQLSPTPIEVHLNQFSYDSPLFKNFPLDDHAAYMRSLAQSACHLSFVLMNRESANSGFVRYLTGRSFEVPLSGALLVQEFSPLMHNFFIPGEHYLEFSTFAELSITRFITERREEAEEVRHRGTAFARERYSDASIIGQIDKFLFFPNE